MYPVRILSIDGGGIRGIIPLKVLEYIENKTAKKIHQLFNVIGGTSTGGIIALGLNSLNPQTQKVYTAEELMKFYTKEADQLFCSKWGSIKGWLSSTYDAENIENYLKKKFGETTLMTELPTSQDCEIMVYSYDLLSSEVCYFNNREAIGNFDARTAFVWQAARATSAAPTFFPALKMESAEGVPLLLIDGGVYINNPVLNLLLRARKKFPHIKQQSQLLVSVGTGQFSPSRKDLENAGKTSWAGSIFEVASMGTSAESEYQTFELLEYLDPQILHDEKEYEQRYYRFQKKFKENVPMDGISHEQIKLLEKLGDELVEEKREELDRLCAILTTPIDINLDSDV